jgi:hypothetical protein
MTPGVLVADQMRRRVIDQRATHALAARRAESCDQQHIVSSLKSSATTSSALTLRHSVAFSDSNPRYSPKRAFARAGGHVRHPCGATPRRPSSARQALRSAAMRFVSPNRRTDFPRPRAGILRNAEKRVGNERSAQRGVPSETASPCFLSLELGLIYLPTRVDIPALARERLAGEARGDPVGKQRTRRRAEYRRWHGTHGVA